MRRVQPTIHVDVDVTNPGQFFACCGLLELADRLWPGAQGWFTGQQFCIASAGTMEVLLGSLGDAQINSSVTDEGLRRLGTLLSAKKSTLLPSDVADKERLHQLWQEERLHLSEPFDLSLDWWRDEHGERTELKTWAAKQFVLEIARRLMRSIQTTAVNGSFQDVLCRTAEVDGPPFYFDSAAYSQITARDTGFSLYKLQEKNVLKSRDATRPILEFSAFIGMQRFRALVDDTEESFRFQVWSVPLSPALAAAATAGALHVPGQRTLEFRLLPRTKYMKAFLPAMPFKGD